MTPSTKKLLEILVGRSYLYRPEKPFVLASGKTSPTYIDCRLTTTFAGALPLIGEVVLESVERVAGARPVAAVGGLTMGADPIAAAVAYWSTVVGRPLSWFTIRKENKRHGTTRWIEGAVERDDRVVVVDDVVTTGGSTVTAIERCREHGLQVVGVVVLVDRGEDDGRRRIEEKLGRGAAYAAVFTRADLERVRDAARS
jgi:orotate phosphoribosyltransferase